MLQSQEKYLTTEKSAYEIVRQFSTEPTPLKEVKVDNNGNVYYEKDETNNPTGAYKWRGAAVKLSKLFENGAHSVVTASAGNHGQGVAWVSGMMGAKAEVFVPLGTPESKINGLARLGASIHLEGNNFDESTELARKFAKHNEEPFVHPFDDFDVMNGQGTIGRELYEQSVNERIHDDDLRVFVAVGGGGQIAGISRELKLLSHNRVKVIGVQVDGSDSAALSFGYNTSSSQYHHSSGLFSRIYSPKTRLGNSYCRIKASQPNDLVDGTRVNMVGDYCMRNIIDFVDEFIVVDPALVGKYYLENPNSRLEPAGALSMVGAQAYAQMPTHKMLNFITIASGQNQDEARIESLKKLATNI
jgi:threonine dehydratase